MTTSYPSSQDSFPRPTASSALTGHASLHDDIADAVEAIESVVGVTGDTTAGTVQKRLSDLESASAPSNLVEFFERTSSFGTNNTTLHTFTFNTESGVLYKLTFFSRIYMYNGAYVQIDVRDGANFIKQTFSNTASGTTSTENLSGSYMFYGTGSSMTLKLQYLEGHLNNYLLGGTSAPIQAMIERVG